MKKTLLFSIFALASIQLISCNKDSLSPDSSVNNLTSAATTDSTKHKPKHGGVDSLGHGPHGVSGDSLGNRPHGILGDSLGHRPTQDSLHTKLDSLGHKPSGDSTKHQSKPPKGHKHG